jgi:hypothetical protein
LHVRVKLNLRRRAFTYSRVGDDTDAIRQVGPFTAINFEKGRLEEFISKAVLPGSLDVWYRHRRFRAWSGKCRLKKQDRRKATLRETAVGLAGGKINRGKWHATS